MGTYSGYAEFCAGYALTVEISLGAWSDPDAEHEELLRRRARLGTDLAPARAPLAKAYAHFADGAHPWRRWLHLLDRSARDYPGPAPEPFWASEARSRGARFPRSLFRSPAPQPQEAPLLGVALDPDQPVWLTLFLASEDVPYLVRELLDVQLVASQFLPGGLFAEAPPPAPPAAEALADAAQGLNRHTAVRLLSAARAEPEVVLERARAAGPTQLVAQAVAVFLDPSQVDPDLPTRVASSRPALTLLAALAPDASWSEQLEALDPCFAELD